jgi:hypothetical protein
MLGPCNEPVKDSGGDLWGFELPRLSVYSTIDNPPPFDMNPIIAEWIRQREMDALIWRSIWASSVGGRQSASSN